jgi:hypothetical protein
MNEREQYYYVQGRRDGLNGINSRVVAEIDAGAPARPTCATCRWLDGPDYCDHDESPLVRVIEPQVMCCIYHEPSPPEGER